ncbi:MAG: hydrogenase maturation factor [Lachnospiraceae bacterium]|nr:hydrogenase maturation factor [Lachnospiraceae bacterium]
MKVGKVAESVLKRSVLKQIKTANRQELISGPSVGADCAVLAFSEGEPRMGVCTQETALRSPADMRRILQRVANSLACGGMHPVAVTISLLLPEVMSEQELQDMMGVAGQVCQELSMAVAGGQTNVSGDVALPHVTVTGIGQIQTEGALLPGGAKPKQDIVISKWIGLEGTATLAQLYEEKLLTRYPSHLVDRGKSFDQYLSVLPEAQIAMEFGVSAMHDVSEGGIFRALWELAESAGVGLTVELKKIPVRQETIEICEFFQINPYELVSGGSLIMVTDDGNGLVRALEQAGIAATVAGKITDRRDRIIVNEEETRFLDRPKEEEIHKVLS